MQVQERATWGPRPGPDRLKQLIQSNRDFTPSRARSMLRDYLQKHVEEIAVREVYEYVSREDTDGAPPSDIGI